VLGAASAPPAGAAASNVTRSAALAAAAVGALAGLVRFGATSRGLVTAVLLGSVAALAVIDFRHQLVPNRVVLPAAAVVLGLRLALYPDHALEWLLTAVITFAAVLALSVLKRDSVGAGDAKVAMLLGAGLGLDVAAALLAGVVVMWPVAAWLVFHDGVDARKKAVPLTPALALGAAVVALTG
jgi:leader peptidase (prepilin peptidase)/N-methyltransferase